MACALITDCWLVGLQNLWGFDSARKYSAVSDVWPTLTSIFAAGATYSHAVMMQKLFAVLNQKCLRYEVLDMCGKLPEDTQFRLIKFLTCTDMHQQDSASVNEVFSYLTDLKYDIFFFWSGSLNSSKKDRISLTTASKHVCKGMVHSCAALDLVHGLDEHVSPLKECLDELVVALLAVKDSSVDAQTETMAALLKKWKLRGASRIQTLHASGKNDDASTAAPSAHGSDVHPPSSPDKFAMQDPGVVQGALGEQARDLEEDDIVEEAEEATIMEMVATPGRRVKRNLVKTASVSSLRLASIGAPDPAERINDELDPLFWVPFIEQVHAVHRDHELLVYLGKNIHRVCKDKPAATGRITGEVQMQMITSFEARIENEPGETGAEEDEEDEDPKRRHARSLLRYMGFDDACTGQVPGPGSSKWDGLKAVKF